MKIHVYLFALLLVVHSAYQQALNCYVPADIMILIDGSDSIQDGNWRQVKSFVRQLVTNFDIGQDAIHVGFVVYSSDIGDHIGLKPFKAKNILQTLSGILKQPKASTNTAKGIEYVRKEFKEHGRIDVPKILIVITDGSSDNPRETRLHANLAKMEGTRVIAVGIGQTFRDELRQIASKPEKVYTAASFATLRTLVTEIRRMVCQVITTTTTTTTAIPIPTQPPIVIPVPTGRICDVPADIVFVVDGSQSIADADFVKLKNFVANLIDNFEIGAQSVHVGVVTYSTIIGDVVSLQPPKNKALLKILTKSLRHPKAGTNTARGILRARDMIRKEGIREDSPKIIVVITDGRSISPVNTKSEADLAKAEGITMIAVGVGTQIFSDELQSIASSSRKVFEVSDFRSLELIIAAMRDLICQVKKPVTTPKPEPPTTPPPYVPPPDGLLCDVPADVGFLLDGSDSIDPRDWTRQKNFVANLINNLNIGRRTIHTGVAVYSTIIGDTIGFIPFKPKALLMAMVRDLKQPKVGTNTARGIKHLRDMLKSQGRLKAPKVMVIITDGKSSSPRKTIAEANLAKQDGITVIALGVGSQIFMEELRQMATNERKLFEVSDFSSLQQIIVALRDLICQVITTPVIVTTTPMPPPSTLPPIPGCEVPADIMMLMHGSRDIKEENWRYNKQFVESLVKNLYVKRTAHNIGMIVYSMSIGDHVGLKPYKDQSALVKLVNNVVHPGVGSNTAAAIAKLREAYREHGRPGAPKIGVIISDSQSSVPDETQVQADLAKTEGVRLITIGVGPRSSNRELNNIATDARKVYQANSFSQIGSLMPEVREMICEIIKTPTVIPKHNFTELCAGCLMDSNTGFNPFPGDCAKYVQCWKDFDEIRGMIKHCPFGQFWDRKAIACRPSMNVQCPADPCLKSPDGFTYGMTRYGCRSYWVCLNAISVGSCCPEGTYYLEGMGCMRGMACKTPCPPDGGLVVSPNCQKKKHWDERKYIQTVPNIGPVVRHCAPGTVFDIGYCSCVVGTSNYVPVTPQDQCRETVYFPFDIDMRDKSGKRTAVGMKNVHRTQRGTLHFNGSSQMNIWRLAGVDWGNKLVIRFKFKFDRWSNRFDYGGHVVDIDWTGDYQWKWDKEFGWRRNITVGGGWDVVTLLKMFRTLYASTSERQMEQNMLRIAESPDFQMLLYHIGFVPEATNAMQILRMLISGQGSIFIRQILDQIGNRQGAHEIRLLLQQLLQIQGIQKWIIDHSGKYGDITMDKWRRFLATLNITSGRWSNDNGWIHTMDDNGLDIIAELWWNFVRENGMTGPEWQNILKWSLGSNGKNGHLDKRWITEMLITVKNETIKNKWLDYLGKSKYIITWNINKWDVTSGTGSGVTGSGWNKWLNWLLRIYYKGTGTDGGETGTGGVDTGGIDTGSLDYWLYMLLNGGGDLSGIGDGIGWGLVDGWTGQGTGDWGSSTATGSGWDSWFGGSGSNTGGWFGGNTGGFGGHTGGFGGHTGGFGGHTGGFGGNTGGFGGHTGGSEGHTGGFGGHTGGFGGHTGGFGGHTGGFGGNTGGFGGHTGGSEGHTGGFGGHTGGFGGHTGGFGDHTGGFGGHTGAFGGHTGGFGGTAGGQAGSNGWIDGWTAGGNGQSWMNGDGWFGGAGQGSSSGGSAGGAHDSNWWFGANYWPGSNNNGMSGNNMGGGSDLFGTNTGGSNGGSVGTGGSSIGTSGSRGSSGIATAAGTGSGSNAGESVRNGDSTRGAGSLGGNGGSDGGITGSSAHHGGSTASGGSASGGTGATQNGYGGNGGTFNGYGVSGGAFGGHGGTGGMYSGYGGAGGIYGGSNSYNGMYSGFGGSDGLFGGAGAGGSYGTTSEDKMFGTLGGSGGTFAGSTGAGGNFGGYNAGADGLYGGSAVDAEHLYGIFGGFNGLLGGSTGVGGSVSGGDASGSASAAGGMFGGSTSGIDGSFSETHTAHGKSQSGNAQSGGSSYGANQNNGGFIGTDGYFNFGGGGGWKGSQGSALGGDSTIQYTGTGDGGYGASGQGAWAYGSAGLGSDWANQYQNQFGNSQDILNFWRSLGQTLTSGSFNSSINDKNYVYGTLHGDNSLLGTKAGFDQFLRQLSAGNGQIGGNLHGTNRGTVTAFGNSADGMTSGDSNFNNFMGSNSGFSSGAVSLGMDGKATSTNQIIDNQSAATAQANGAAINVKSSLTAGFGNSFGSSSVGGGSSSNSQSQSIDGLQGGGGNSAHSSSASSSGGTSHEGLDAILGSLGGVANGQGGHGGGGSSSSSSTESGEIRFGGGTGGMLFPLGLSDADIFDGLLIGSGEVYRKKREAVARKKRAAAHAHASPYQTLISNCQGNSQMAPSISISANNRHVKFQLKTSASMNVAEMELPLVPNWNEVTLVYDGNNMHCKVKNWRGVQKNSVPLNGKIERRQGGLMLGTCGGRNNFKGEMDDLMVYNCLPSTFKQTPPK